MENIVKGINAIFESESPTHLVNGLEAFVGLLRGCKQATPVDLELFFMDAKKLSNKLKRMESHGLKYEIVKKHKEILEEEVKYFVDKQPESKTDFNLGPYRPLI